MEELFEDLERLQKSERRVAMATLIATRGTTPKREGAKLWIGEDGRILGSVTIGGCVDARVIKEAETVLATSEAMMISMSLADEDAWESGFTCGGSVDVLIEPVDLDAEKEGAVHAYRVVRSEVEQGRWAIVVARPGQPSSKLVVLQNGETAGSLGDRAFDLQAAEMAHAPAATLSSRLISVNGVDLFFEVHGPISTLIVFGAGHVAMPLVSLGRALGFRTIVVDGRPRFASRDRFAGADEIRIGIPSEIAAELSYNSRSFIILVAHDYKYEIPVLKRVLRSDAAYIGLLGNRVRGQAILDALGDDGLSPDLLARVRVPVGLDIGARSAAEIALSILAEVVAVRSGRSGASLSGR